MYVELGEYDDFDLMIGSIQLPVDIISKACKGLIISGLDNRVGHSVWVLVEPVLVLGKSLLLLIHVTCCRVDILKAL